MPTANAYVLLTFGQSNGEGEGAGNLPNRVGVTTYEFGRTTGRFGVDDGFVGHLRANGVTDDIIVINASWQGTSLSQITGADDWNVASSELLADLIADAAPVVSAALSTYTGVTAYANLNNGETDSSSATRAAAWEQNAEDIMDALRTGLSLPGLRYAITELLSSGTRPYVSTVQAGQNDAAADDGNAFVVASDGLERRGTDAEHLTYSGYAYQGEQIAKDALGAASKVSWGYYGTASNDTIGSNNEAVFGMDGNDTINTGGSDDLGFGGNGDDWIDGGSGNDYLNGGEGNDFLYGNVGEDFLFGHNGDDVLKPGSSSDTVHGGNGVDTVDYSNAGADVGVDLTTGLGTGDMANGDTYFVVENIIGGGYSDTLTGNAEVNKIEGGTGQDTISGKDGNDILHGDAGHDTLYGDAGLDSLFGSDGQDTLYGGSGADALDGGAGHDWFYAGTGVDSLNAGGGEDTFVWRTQDNVSGERDTVTGFGTGDTLRLEGLTATFATVGSDTLVTLYDGGVKGGEVMILGQIASYVSGQTVYI